MRRRQHLIAVISLACICASVRAQGQLHGWTYRSVTPAIDLSEVEETPASINLVFANVSGRGITAFAVSLSWGEDRYFDYFDGQPSRLSPEATYRLRLDPQSIPAGAARSIVIQAAVFEDGSSDGALQQIGCINSKRLGRVLESERIRYLLSGLTADATTSDATVTLTQKIGRLPESFSVAYSSLQDTQLAGVSVADLDRITSRESACFLEGVRNERETALRRVNDMSGPSGSRPESRAADRGSGNPLSLLRQEYEELRSAHLGYFRLRGGSHK